MPKTWFTRETFNRSRLARDHFSTSSHANLQVTQFYKTHAIYNCIENTENARVGEEFKGLILATMVWYEIFAAGFHFCDVFFSQFPRKRTRKINLSLICNTKNPWI